MTNSPSPKHLLASPKYRPDIDGLRAIAVIAVVGFHAFPEWIKGGFVGVDVFFVISGFLISTIIFNSLQRDSFSFIEFYSRRVKRIFPALLLVLIFCLVAGWFTLLADEYKQLGKHIVGGVGFVSNFVFLNEAGYFDNSAETKPLLHLWSLGVEEQFYIVWPLLLWLAWKKRFNLLAIAIIICVVSFLLNTTGVLTDPARNFYSPQTRFWELLVGAVLAYMALYKNQAVAKFQQEIDAILGRLIYAKAPRPNGKTLRDLQSILGILLILVSIVLITKERAFPGWWAVLPVAGSTLIISAGAHSWGNRVLFSGTFLVGLGKISYPLYLWHWPLISFLRILEGETPSLELRITVVIISIALAWATYFLFEKPIRFTKGGKSKVICLVTLMAVVGGGGYNVYSRNGLEFRVKEFQLVSKAVGNWQYPGGLKEFSFQGRRFNFEKSGNNEITLFLGDSNIEQYYPRIDQLIKDSPQKVNSVIFFSQSGCFPVKKSPYNEMHKSCEGLADTAFDLARSRKDIVSVVIGAQWNGYLSTGFGLTGKFGHGEEDYKKALLELTQYIKELRGLDKQVALVLNIPTGPELDPKYMAKRSLKNFPNVFTIRNPGVEYKRLAESYGLIQSDLRAAAEDAGALVIDPLEFLCNNGICPGLDASGDPIYIDGAHLRADFVRYNAKFVDSLVINK